MSSTARLRVLLVDDHALLRAGIRELIETEDDIVVVGEAANGDQALAALVQRPDVVVLDVEIPGDRATVTVRRLRNALPDVRILILSMHDEPRVVEELLALGVSGYLLKSIKRADFIAAVRSARDDVDHVVLSISRRSVGGDGVLTDRERELLKLVSGAMSNAQIAHRLGITEGTVKRHLRNIFAKLNAVSRIDAVNKAMEGRDLSPRVV